MWYIGLDAHQRTSSICILDQHGVCVQQETVRGDWQVLLERLRAITEPFAICYEASLNYGFLYEKLRQVARRVTVAHPGQLRLIFRSKQKNDRADAQKLAKLLFLNAVPEAHVPHADVRSWRQLIEYRHRLITKRTRTKNTLRAILRRNGLTAPMRLWTRRGRCWIQALTFDSPADTLQRDLAMDELAQFDRQVQRVESRLNEMGGAHPAVALLMTIPGVGIRTAEAVVAYIDRPDRFQRSKQIGAYFGLVPCQNSSAAANRLGHITRSGPGTVRKLLVEATWQGIRRSKAIRRYFDRVAAGKPDRRKIALVATAHYLARVMLAMLRTGEAWRAPAQA